MKPLILLPLALAAASGAPSPSAPARPSASPVADTYKVDPVHSGVLFRIKHMDVSYFYGRFDQVTGTYSLDREKPSKSTVTIEIDAGSVDTNSADRDKHIKSQDFLNVNQYPTITFDSSKVRENPDEEDTYRITGELELHGVSREVTFDMHLVGVKDTRMGPRSGFEGELTLERRDFGMETFPDEALGNEIRLIFFIEGTRE